MQGTITVTAAMAVISVKERRLGLRDVMQLTVRELVREEPGFQLVNCALLPICLSANRTDHTGQTLVFSKRKMELEGVSMEKAAFLLCSTK